MHICKYCGREFETAFQRNGHEGLCLLNPQREERIRKAAEATRQVCHEKSLADPLNEVKTYDLICAKCGKHYSLDIRLRDYQNGRYKKTCSVQCAHSHLHSVKSKEKLIQSLNKSMKEEHECKCKHCGKTYVKIGYGSSYCPECWLELGLCKKPKDGKNHNIGLHKVICENCGKEVYAKDDRCCHCMECAKKLHAWPYQIYYADGRKYYTLEYRQHLQERAKQLMKEGKIKPWLSRNITSYAERFFMKVLDLNRVKYEREYSVGGYFLDFYIEQNGLKIDFEVDGKQHWNDPERAQHDIERDEKLKSLRLYCLQSKMELPEH